MVARSGHAWPLSTLEIVECSTPVNSVTGQSGTSPGAADR
jgi:hypothetical protein